MTQSVLKPVEELVALCKQTFSWLPNPLFDRFDNRLNLCLHDAAPWAQSRMVLFLWHYV